MTLKPVIQMEKSGCGIAAAAAVAGVTYVKAKRIASGLGIHAAEKPRGLGIRDVRALLGQLGVKLSSHETPFTSWGQLPDVSLLAIKWSVSKGVPCWHWVTFVRQGPSHFVLDPKRGLRSNIRTDFGRMRPKWFIAVRG